jgi:hypothetical protein
MTQQHTPPPELVQQWGADWYRSKEEHLELEPYLVAKAAQWGADQELEACCEWLESAKYGDTFGVYTTKHVAANLRAARRPKQPSLKEQALAALNEIEDRYAGPSTEEILIRRALEQLDD